MYGSPTSDFEIKGTVTTEEGRAVEGAEIRVTGSDEPSGYYTFSTTATNKYGEYFTYGEGHGWSSMKVVCIPEDDDLEPDSVIIKMNYVGKDGWYWGLAKETVNFTLKKKE